MFGLAFSLVVMSVNVSFMNHVEEGFMAKISGILNAITMGSVPVVSALCFAAVSFFDINTIFIYSGIIGVIIFVSVPFMKILEKL